MGIAENIRKSGLLENKMQAIGEEKVIFWSYICPLNMKNSTIFAFNGHL